MSHTENAALAAFKDPIATAEKHLRHLCSAVEWSDKKYSDTGEHLTVETAEARAVADMLRTIANPEPAARAPMTHPDALALLHRRAGTHAGHSDPYLRAVLPPVPLEWATPAERQEWREMVIALTDATLPDLPIPAAVWQYARNVADTTL